MCLIILQRCRAEGVSLCEILRISIDILCVSLVWLTLVIILVSFHVSDVGLSECVTLQVSSYGFGSPNFRIRKNVCRCHGAWAVVHNPSISRILAWQFEKMQLGGACRSPQISVESAATPPTPHKDVGLRPPHLMLLGDQ